MGSFLRTNLNKQPKVTLELPMAIPFDADYQVLVTNDATVSGDITLRVDGMVYLTINKDGVIDLKGQLKGKE